MDSLILGNALDLLVDNRGKNPPYVESGIPVYSAKAIKGGCILKSEARFISESTYEAWMPMKLRKNDVILTSEAPLGKSALVPDGDPIAIAQRLYGLRGKADVLDGRYLHYALQSEGVQNELISRASGTTVMGIRQPELLKVRIPDPGYPRQCAIGGVLGALDDKIAVNERVAASAGILADVVFAAAVSSLTTTSMSDLVSPILGGTPDRKVASFWGAGVPWASAKDVAAATSGVVASTEESITDLAASETRAKPVPCGSVILTARGTVGAVARVMTSTALNQSCYAFTPGELPSGVLFQLIRLGSDQLLGVSHGTVFSTVNMKTFDHIKVPDVRRVDLQGLEAKIAPLHRTVEARVKESATLAALRDTLLPQFMSGKLRVRDAEKIVEDAV